MSKTKSQKSIFDQISPIAQQAGLIVMTAAATIGMLEMPDHTGSKIIVPNQPAFAFAGENQLNDEQNNPMRREKEDVESHYISYSVAQRTPARAGKR